MQPGLLKVDFHASFGDCFERLQLVCGRTCGCQRHILSQDAMRAFVKELLVQLVFAAVDLWVLSHSSFICSDRVEMHLLISDLVLSGCLFANVSCIILSLDCFTRVSLTVRALVLLQLS